MSEPENPFPGSRPLTADDIALGEVVHAILNPETAPGQGGTWTEAGRSEYTLGFDGSETMAWWEPGDDGELELADVKVSPGRPRTLPPGTPLCRVYWGSHGCELARGHEGDCDCGCCECVNHPDPGSGCVGKAPYYGPETRFYGEDVAARGLPAVND